MCELSDKAVCSARDLVAFIDLFIGRYGKTILMDQPLPPEAASDLLVLGAQARECCEVVLSLRNKLKSQPS